MVNTSVSSDIVYPRSVSPTSSSRATYKSIMSRSLDLDLWEATDSLQERGAMVNLHSPLPTGSSSLEVMGSRAMASSNPGVMDSNNRELMDNHNPQLMDNPVMDSNNLAATDSRAAILVAMDNHQDIRF